MPIPLGVFQPLTFSRTVKNVLYAKFMPISILDPFDNTGLPYDISQIITNGTFDQTKYEAYSPLFLSTTNAIAYSMCFAIFPATIVHTARKFVLGS